ncbi:MAG TPA: hypothetical protein VIO38_12375 [Rariglobus sp.]
MTILSATVSCSTGDILYARLCDRESLREALQTVLRHADFSGLTDTTFAPLRTEPELFLSALQRDLLEHTYRPGPVLMVSALSECSCLKILLPRDRVVCVALLGLLKEESGIAAVNEGRSLAQLEAALPVGRYALVNSDPFCRRHSTFWALLRSVVPRISNSALLGLLRSLFRAPVVQSKRQPA